MALKNSSFIYKLYEISGSIQQMVGYNLKPSFMPQMKNIIDILSIASFIERSWMHCINTSVMSKYRNISLSLIGMLKEGTFVPTLGNSKIFKNSIENTKYNNSNISKPFIKLEQVTTLGTEIGAVRLLFRTRRLAQS